MFHQYQQTVIFVTVQLLDTGLLMPPKLRTILDPKRKQKTIMNFEYRKVKSTNFELRNSFKVHSHHVSIFSYL